jgi:hypothetical protein
MIHNEWFLQKSSEVDFPPCADLCTVSQYRPAFILGRDIQREESAQYIERPFSRVFPCFFLLRKYPGLLLCAFRRASASFTAASRSAARLMSLSAAAGRLFHKMFVGGRDDDGAEGEM